MINLHDKYGKVVVIMGGVSNEREISLMSGNAVYNSLVKSGVDVYIFDPLKDCIKSFIDSNYSKAIILLHGKQGEDGTIQGLLEFLGIPYNGSGVAANVLSFNKYYTKLVWKENNIPLPDYQLVNHDNFDFKNFILKLKYPIIIKPTSEGSTIGITKVFNPDNLEFAINYAFKFSNQVLIEQLIIGEEISVTINNNTVLPYVKIIAPNDNYDFDNKYFIHETKYICPYSITKIDSLIEELSIKAYKSVGASGIARIDIMIDKDNNLYFIEINTIPGMTAYSLVPMCYNAIDINFDSMCLQLLDEIKLYK